MSPTLEELHCPNPDCSDGIEPHPEQVRGGVYQVRCVCCGMTGPQKAGKTNAVRAWKKITFAVNAA